MAEVRPLRAEKIFVVKESSNSRTPIIWILLISLIFDFETYFIGELAGATIRPYDLVLVAAIIWLLVEFSIFKLKPIFPFIGLVILYLLILLSASVYSTDPAAGIKETIILTRFFVLFYVVVNLIRNWVDVVTATKCYIFIGLIVGLFSIYQVIGHIVFGLDVRVIYGFRPTTFFSEPAWTAQILTFSFMSLTMFARARLINFQMIIVLLIIIGFGVVVTLARAAWLHIFFIILGLYYSIGIVKIFKMLPIILLSFIIIIFLIFILDAYSAQYSFGDSTGYFNLFLTRLQSMLAFDDLASVIPLRNIRMTAMYETLASNPSIYILGIGPGNWNEFSGNLLAGVQTGIHNEYMNALYGAGIPALTVLVLIFLQISRLTFKAFKQMDIKKMDIMRDWCGIIGGGVIGSFILMWWVPLLGIGIFWGYIGYSVAVLNYFSNSSRNI